MDLSDLIAYAASDDPELNKLADTFYGGGLSAKLRKKCDPASLAAVQAKAPSAGDQDKREKDRVEAEARDDLREGAKKAEVKPKRMWDQPRVTLMNSMPSKLS
jgi:hypothetical protein